MAEYAVGRHWGTNLEPGTWFEIVHDDARGLIAGFVFMSPKGEVDYRDIDGKKLKAARADWDAVIGNFKRAQVANEVMRRSA